MTNHNISLSDVCDSFSTSTICETAIIVFFVKVKEIRARYKSRDYENFAIPKRRTGSSSHNSSRKGSVEITVSTTFFLLLRLANFLLCGFDQMFF